MLWCVVIQGWKSDFASGDKTDKRASILYYESLKKLKSAQKLSSILGKKSLCQQEPKKTDLLKSATDLLIKVIAKEAF